MPSSLIIPYKNDETSIKMLIDAVFLNLNQYYDNINIMTNRVILIPNNDCVDEINKLFIQKFPGDAVTYYSFDEPMDKNEYSFEDDFLTALCQKDFLRMNWF